MGFGQRPPVVEKYHAIRTNAAIIGVPIPILFGQQRLTGRLIWYGDFTAHKAKQQGGKGLGKGGSQYVYTASIMAVLCFGPISALLSVWDNNGRFVVDSVPESYTISGAGVYKVSNYLLYGNDQGAATFTTFSHSVNDYGSPGPTTLSGTTLTPMTPVAGVNVSETFTGDVLSNNWTVDEGTFAETLQTLQIATVGANNRAVARYTAATPTTDHTSAVVISSSPSSNGAFGPAARITNSNNYYGFYCDSANAYLYKVVAGTVTVINSAAHAGLAQGDVVLLKVAGTALTGTINGTTVCSGTDSSLTTGTFGIAGNLTYPTSSSISSWIGSSASATPTSGQYSVNYATGEYTFAAADAGKTVQITYGFYRYILEAEELSIVPFSGPFTVTVQNASTYHSDIGVNYFPSGLVLTKISSGTPTQGQYKQNSSGVYTFAAADAGQGIIINYEYRDPNTDNNAPEHVNLTLIAGNRGQPAWSYLSTNHSSQALGYTQLAMIASSKLYLGFTPQLPNYTYEIAGLNQFGGGIVDANPADCITSLLTNPAFGIGFPSANIGSLTNVRNCWTAYSFFISALLENQSSAASVIGQWLEAGSAAAFWSEGLLKIVPYCDTSQVGNGILYQPNTSPIANFTDDDYLDAAEPVKFSRTRWQDAYNRVQVSYSARINDYNPELIYEQDDGSIQRYQRLSIEDPVTYDFITTLVSAQYAASMRLQRYVYIRNTYQFRVKSTNSFLEPMDVITITDTYLGLNAKPVRIQKVEDDPVQGLTITAEEFIWGSAAPLYNPKNTNAPPPPLPGNEDPYNTAAIIFEVPSRLGLHAGNIIYGFCNGKNQNWGGCHVWISYDGSNYQQLPDANGGTVNFPARIGTLTANLASYGGANPDTSDTLSVAMQDETPLSSTTSGGAAANVTLCVIVSGGPTLELLSYQTATLAGVNTYNLTTLYRAIYGTSAGAHITGDFFARLDEASFQIQFDPTYVGKTIFIKFTSFNLLGQNEQSLDKVQAFSFTIAGSGPGSIDLNTGFLLPAANPSLFIGAYSGSVAYIIGNEVTYAGNYYICIANTTGNAPTNTSFWQLVSLNSNVFLGNWSSSTAYVAGNQVIDVAGGGGYYIATNPSTNQQPSTHPGSWQLITPGNVNSYLGNWSSSTAYVDGQTVSYLGSLWVAISPGTNNTPSLTSSFWTLLGCNALFTGNWSSSTAYTQNMIAVQSGNEYQCILAHTNQQPPNATYWQLLGPATLDNLVDGTIYIRGLQYASKTITVDNANFQASSTIPPPGWTVGGGVTASYETSTPYKGTQSLKFTTAAQYERVTAIKKWNCSPGDQFYISAAIKGDGSSAPYVQWVFLDSSGSEINHVSAPFSGAANTWQVVTGTGTAPAGTVSANIQCVNGATGGAGTSWFDDINVDRITLLGQSVTDGPQNFSATASTLTYRPTSNPLTGHDAGSNVTINIGAFTMRTSSKGDISVSSGSVPSLNYKSLYYIYYDDATLAGGGVTYNATQTKETAIQGVGRFYVGSIITPIAGGSDTTGNNDGGTGAQYGQYLKVFFSTVATTQLANGGFTSSIANANDGSDVTKTTLDTNAAGGAIVRGSLVTLTLSLPPIALNLFSSATLKVKSASTLNTANPINGSATGALLEYSLDGGASYTTVYQTTNGVTRALTIDSVSLTSPLNLSRILVQVQVDNLGGTGTLSGEVTQDLYEAWLEIVV